ncbi:MAG TPA: hypothetical protein VNO31_20250 [Umezawaea sp.]|nr:hypothetical protein [Umezawaea sp.]
MSIRTGLSLHKGLGVRAPRLVEVRTGRLAGKLFINRDDAASVVLAKVLWQVENAIGSVAKDLRDREVLRYGYNLPRDVVLNGLKGQDRLKRLAEEREQEVGWKWNCTNKLLFPLVLEVVDHWNSSPVEAPVEEVEELVRLEEAFARGGRGVVEKTVSVGVHRLLRDSGSARTHALDEAFPQFDLYFEINAEGCVETVRFPDLGEYFCAFTEPELLDEYLRLTGRTSSGRRLVKKGREVLAVLGAHPGVGIAVDPVVGDGAWHLWTPAEVAQRGRQPLKQGV